MTPDLPVIEGKQKEIVLVGFNQIWQMIVNIKVSNLLSHVLPLQNFSCFFLCVNVFEHTPLSVEHHHAGSSSLYGSSL